MVLSICLSLSLSLCPSVRLTFSVCVCVSVCLSVCPSVRLSVCLSVCMFCCLQTLPCLLPEYGTSVLMQDPVTNTPAVLVFVHNITQQKQMEMQLAQRQEALQR